MARAADRAATSGGMGLAPGTPCRRGRLLNAQTATAPASSHIDPAASHGTGTSRPNHASTTCTTPQPTAAVRSRCRRAGGSAWAASRSCGPAVLGAGGGRPASRARRWRRTPAQVGDRAVSGDARRPGRHRSRGRGRRRARARADAESSAPGCRPPRRRASRMSTSRVRGPQRTPRTRCHACSTAWVAARRSGPVERRAADGDGVQVGILLRAADRDRSRRRRHRVQDEAVDRAEVVDGALQDRRRVAEVGSQGERDLRHRRGAPARCAARRRRTAPRSARAACAPSPATRSTPGNARQASAMRSARVSMRSTGSPTISGMHGVRDLAVVDGVGEVVGAGGGGRAHVEVDVDRELLPVAALVLEHAVVADAADARGSGSGQPCSLPRRHAAATSTASRLRAHVVHPHRPDALVGGERGDRRRGGVALVDGRGSPSSSASRAPRNRLREAPTSTG